VGVVPSLGLEELAEGVALQAAQPCHVTVALVSAATGRSSRCTT
jgi:hypothetical protein